MHSVALALMPGSAWPLAGCSLCDGGADTSRPACSKSRMVMAQQPPATQRRRPRHLMDPNNLQRPQPGGMSLTRVQQWVLSALALTTVLHLSAGLVVAA